MPIRAITNLGQQTQNAISAFGDFCVFVAQTFSWMFNGGLRWKNLRNLPELMYEVGVRSVPVISVTGAFVGMVMAIETYSQLKALGQEERMGSLIGLSVVKQIGPVLAAVMLAGRIGGALTAELGTMNVTEQLDALRVMGAEPVRYLVVPRFLACLFLLPMLTIYSDVLGVVGGWMVSVHALGVPNDPYWRFSASGIETYQVMEGIIKSFAFGAAIGLISCFKGFRCGSGASGVGRACTESFVLSFLAIIILNFFFAKLLRDVYDALYPARGLFG
jgi:phospholipid/cholesterol/gamma-HCH transport system permease protein